MSQSLIVSADLNDYRHRFPIPLKDVVRQLDRLVTYMHAAGKPPPKTLLIYPDTYEHIDRTIKRLSGGQLDASSVRFHGLRLGVRQAVASEVL